MASLEDRAERAYNQGLQFAAAGHLEEARRSFDEAATLQPQDESGRTASKLVSDAISGLIGANALGHFLKGAQLAQERSQYAVAEIEHGTRLAPTYAPGFQALGFVQGLCGRFSDSERSFLKAVDLAPDSPESHFNLGRFYHLRAQPSSAERHYRDALDIDNGFAPAMRYLTELVGPYDTQASPTAQRQTEHVPRRAESVRAGTVNPKADAGRGISAIGRVLLFALNVIAFAGGILLTFGGFGPSAHSLSKELALLCVAPGVICYAILPIEEYLYVGLWLGDFGFLLLFGPEQYVKLVVELVGPFLGVFVAALLASLLLGVACGGFMLLPVIGLNGVLRNNPVTQKNIGVFGGVIAATYATFLFGLGFTQVIDSCILLWQGPLEVGASAAVGMLVGTGFAAAVLYGLKERKDKWSARGAMDQALRYYASR